MRKKHAVGIVENHPVFMHGLEFLIMNSQNFELRFCVPSGHLALAELEKNVVDILLVDLDIPVISGPELIKIINREGYKTRIVVISVHSDNYNITNAFKNGVRAYCSKDCSAAEILRIMNAVINTKEVLLSSNLISKKEMLQNSLGIESHGLTSREIEIIILLSKDFNIKEIASKLFISMHTVHSHRKNILRKLNVTGNIGIINAAKNQGII